jgi:hypothetical protein
MTIQFTPKTAAERQAFLQQADAEKAEADATSNACGVNGCPA